MGDKQENTFYLLVSFETGPVLGIKIYMTETTQMEEYILFLTPTFQAIFFFH